MRVANKGMENKMEMKKDVHLSAKDLLEMVQLKPGVVGVAGNFFAK